MIFVHFCENNAMCCSCCCRRLKTGSGSPSPSDFQSIVCLERFLHELKKRKKKVMTMCLQRNAAFRKKKEDDNLTGAFGFNFQ